MRRFLESPANRRAVYRSVAATLTLLASYGIVSGDEIKTWLDLTTEILAVAGLLLASYNTEREPRYPAVHPSRTEESEFVDDPGSLDE